MARPAPCAPAKVVVEIDAAAERLVDTRSTRRLVPLELSDVAVPPSAGSAQAPVLFFRVLGGPDGTLRIELWERGEYHGERALSGVGANPQLVARRVALVAAELGRRLARKREAHRARQQRLLAVRAARERERLARTQDGPLALRSELAAAGAGTLRLFGPRVSGELSLRGPLRLDIGGEWLGGYLREEAGQRLLASAQGMNVGPAYRLVLSPVLDLDLRARAAALLLQLPAALQLDGLPDQTSSWTARVEAGAQLQLRLSRQLRLGLGGELGGLLRAVPYVAPSTATDRVRGLWWGAAVALVATPP